MKPKTLISAVVLFTALCGLNSWEWKTAREHLDPDTFKSVSELIMSKGYPVESHTVQTSDGFILTVYRIPHGRNGHYNDGVHREVVLLQHGIMAAAFDWVINFQNQSLGFILADADYDVWMGNTRGNIYSRQHVKYTPEMNEFWNFSFDEMAAYDLTATIDYVLNATGEEQLYYIGHSQGTTSMFALLSESPEYNRKVKLFIALAPVVFLGHMNIVINFLSSNIHLFVGSLGVNEFMSSNNSYWQMLVDLTFSIEKTYLYETIVAMFFKRNNRQLNTTRFSVYKAHYPAGTSTKSLYHYAQLVNSKLFCKYDYGEEENMKIYKQKTPPEYCLSCITTPVAIIASIADTLVDLEDVNLLKQKLRNLVYSYIVPWTHFDHMDFQFALDAKNLVYDKCLKLLIQQSDRDESQNELDF